MLGAINGEIGTVKRSRRRITFSRSPRTRHEADDVEEPAKRRIHGSAKNRVAVYAGGRNVKPSRIAGEVRRRIIRIVSDTI